MSSNVDISKISDKTFDEKHNQSLAKKEPIKDNYVIKHPEKLI